MSFIRSGGSSAPSTPTGASGSGGTGTGVSGSASASAVSGSGSASGAVIQSLTPSLVCAPNSVLGVALAQMGVSLAGGSSSTSGGDGSSGGGGGGGGGGSGTHGAGSGLSSDSVAEFKWPAELDRVRAPYEQYISHAQLKGCLLVVSAVRLHVLQTDRKTQKVVSRSLVDLHEVRIDVDSLQQPLILHVTFRETKKSKIQGKYAKLLHTQSFEMANRTQRDLFELVIRAAARNLWQAFFEVRFIPNPDIYQAHCILTKFTRKKKRLTRCLLLTMDKVYNLSLNSTFEPEVLRWTFGYNSIVDLEVFAGNPRTFSFTLQPRTASLGGVRTTSLPDRFIFEANSDHERKWIMHEISRLYSLKMRNQLVTKLFQAKKGAFSMDELMSTSKGKKPKKTEVKRSQKLDKKRSSFIL
eukprot:CAMPEP_0177646710 /NCGR_PEP_ID=MMETSP0447-20121125/9914_1 /TAXON_ID=0 /ORGANISM="Stygamoeba regulata, Strain BSH-02190019" /LENGTH=410 /DNA_ID=CAMNT_0019149251 /DNA_START=63 /DNA_END=1295 /DNA_ORIENTATION=+